MFGKPWHISDVVTEFMVRCGYQRQQWASALEEAWRQASGPRFASLTQIGRLHRGVLEVLAASSPALQELAFQKQNLLRRLQQLLPDQPIHDLRFRLGRIQ